MDSLQPISQDNLYNSIIFLCIKIKIFIILNLNIDGHRKLNSYDVTEVNLWEVKWYYWNDIMKRYTKRVGMWWDWISTSLRAPKAKKKRKYIYIYNARTLHKLSHYIGFYWFVVFICHKELSIWFEFREFIKDHIQR